MRNLIVRRDYSLMHMANNWDAPRWIQLYALGSTRGGDGWLWFAIGLAILLFGGPDRFAAVGGASMAAVLSVAAFIWLKRFTGRKRPCYIEPHCWATLLPGSILVPLRPHDDGICGVCFLVVVHSGACGWPLLLCLERGYLADSSWHALP